MAQMAKNPPAVQETWVRSLDREDRLEKGKATHSSILACRMPWTEEPGGLQSMGAQRVGHGCATNTDPARSHLILIMSAKAEFPHPRVSGFGLKQTLF